MDVVGAAIIQGGKILVVRAKGHPRTWIFTGGRLETRENTMECLDRELREELPGLRFTIGGFLGVYWGSLYRERKIRLIVYRVSSGVQFTLGEGILEALWVEIPSNLHIAEPTAKAIAILKKKGDL